MSLSPRPFPGLLQALFLLGTCTGLMCCGGILTNLETLTEAIAQDGTPLFDDHPVSISIINVVCIGITLILGHHLSRASWQELLALRPFAPRLVAALVPTAIGLCIVLSELDNLTRLAIPMPTATADSFTDLFKGEKSPVGTFFMAVLVAPITEELLFRGLILRGFVLRYGRIPAIVLSALLFGLFHLNPWQFVGATIGGLVLGWLVWTTRSIWPGIILHAIYNATPQVAGSLLTVEIPGFNSDLGTEVIFQPGWFNVLGLILVIGGLTMSIRILRPPSGTEP